MPRPRLRPGIAVCACSWRAAPSVPRQPPRSDSRASISTSVPSTEQTLDFLYPAFGFFSRSLPSASPFILSRTRSSTIDLVTGEQNAATNYTRATGSRRRAFGPSTTPRCICGSTRTPCMRCRAVSTSAVTRPITYGDEEVLQDAPASVYQGHAPTRSPIPPQMTAYDASSGDEHADQSKGSSGKAGSSRQSEWLDPCVVTLLSASSLRPTARVNVRKSAADQARKWLEKRRSRTSGIRTLVPVPGSRRHSRQIYSDRLAVQKELDRHLRITRALQQSGMSDLTPKERGSWISILSRLTKQLPAQIDAPTTESHDVKPDHLRLLAGRRMEALLDDVVVAPAGAPAYHEAALRLEAMCLSGRLPPISELPTFDSSLEFDKRRETYLSSLRAVFLTDASSDPDPDRLRSLRRTTLATLLDCWSRSADGAEQAFHFVIGWQQQYLIDSSLATDQQSAYCRVLRRRYGQLLARLLPSPAQWLAERLSPTSGRHQAIFRDVVEVMAVTGSSMQSLQIWHQALQLRGKPEMDDIRTMATVLEGLLQSRSMQDAKDFAGRLRNAVKQLLPSIDEPDSTLLQAEFDQLSEEFNAVLVYALRMIARTAAQDGNSSWTDTTLATLRVLGQVSQAEKASRQIRAASKRNRAEAARRIFDYALQDTTMDRRSQARLYTAMVVAYVREDDLEAAKALLEQMLVTELSAPLQLVNSLLFGYAARHDVEAVYILFERLSTGDLTAAPDVNSYHALVTAHCNVRDIDSARNALDRMQAARIKPNQAIWTTLMNAYVELADWQRAFDIYNFLEKHSDPLMYPDTASFNVLLKACVLSSAPAQTVLQVFRQWLGRGLRPNSATYTLLMQSVCNAGLMDVAESLFRTVDEAKINNSLPVSMDTVEPDVFMFSNMIAGYVKIGQRAKARACLAEMRRRGIEPSSVTYAIIVDSFVRSRHGALNRKSVADASKFALDFLAASPLEAVRHRQLVRLDRALAREDELNDVFAPVLQAQAKLGDAADALATFKVILNAGAKPSINLYTTLMDAYRRQDDVEVAADNIRTVWSGLHNSVLEAYASERVVKGSIDASVEQRNGPRRSRLQITPSQCHALCLPLSIYIDALDKAGRTFELRQTWNTLARQGFAFDASNWNALATHYAHVHDIEKACWIIEHVLLKPPSLDAVPDPDASLVRTLQFATAGRASLASPRRTPSRMAAGREPERIAHAKAPISFDKILAQGDGLMGEAGPDVSEVARIAQDKRRMDYWFPYASLLAALDTGLAEMTAQHAHRVAEAGAAESAEADAANAVKIQQELEERYPETFRTLHYRAERADGRKSKRTRLSE